MGGQSTAVVDFGAWPGKSDASVVITGQTGIVAGSLVEAWLFPADTGTLGTAAYHSHDEHLVERILVTAGTIVAATGFTIYAVCSDHSTEPLLPAYGGGGPLSIEQGTQRAMLGGIGRRLQGTYTVAWVWN